MSFERLINMFVNALMRVLVNRVVNWVFQVVPRLWRRKGAEPPSGPNPIADPSAAAPTEPGVSAPVGDRRV